MNRRSFLQVSAGGAITLPEFQPKSALRVAEHPVDRAKFPVIDIHTHLFSLGRQMDPASAEAAEMLHQIAAWMDDAITAAVKDDEPAIERIAGEVRDMLAAFPMAGWSPGT